MRLIRAILVAAALALVVDLPPGAVRAAELPAPVLTTPVGGTADDVSVEFAWQRVDGAVAYHLRAIPGPGPIVSDDELLLNERTVNDELIAFVRRPGSTITWSLAAIAADGTEGPQAQATFTAHAARLELLGPDDGATIVYPDDPTELRWRGPDLGRSSAWRDGQPGSDVPLDATADPSSSGFGGLHLYESGGSWRWSAGWHSPDTLPAALVDPPRTFTMTWRDGVPTDLQPDSGTVIGQNEAIDLSWNDVPGAWGYSYQLAPAGRLEEATIGLPVPRTFAETPPLQTPGTYEWRVRAELTQYSGALGRAGAWSPVHTFVVQALEPPNVTSPADGALVEEWPLLRWDPVPSVPTYEVEVSDAPSPSPAGGIWVGGPAFAFRPERWYSSWWQPGSVTRWWRVRASADVWGRSPGEWSAWRSFTVQPTGNLLQAPAAAVRLGPADCGVVDPCPLIPGIPLLRWEPVQGALFYRLFTDWNGAAELESYADVAGTAYPIDTYRSPSPDARTAWAVVACPSEEACPTSWAGATSRFRAGGLPTPVLEGPADGTVQVNPAVKLSWQAGPVTAADDGLPVASVTEVEATILDRYDTRIATKRLSGLTSTFVDGLEDGYRVEWRARAVAAYAGFVGEWSDSRTVTRQLPLVEIVGPADGAVVSATPRLSWVRLNIPGDGFLVEIARDGDLATRGWYGAGWRQYAISASLIPYPELPPGPYTWRIRHETVYVEGTWTYGHFTVAGDPEIRLLEPAAGATVRADDVDLAWEPMPGMDEYTIQIGPLPDLTHENAVYVGYSNTQRHHVAMRLPEGPLYWRACGSIPSDQAWSCSATSGLTVGQSEVRMMTVVAPPGPADVTAPVIAGLTVTPRLDSALGSAGRISATVAWSASDAGSGIAAQHVEISRDGGAYSPLLVSATARSVPITLVPGHSYRVRAQVTDLAGNVGGWVATTSKVALLQERSSIWRWSASWVRARPASASGGATRRSSIAGARATATVYGRIVALVAPRSTTRGSAEVWVDGVRAGTIRLDRSPLGSRRIVFVRRWTTSGTHRIQVRVLGTRGHPRIDLDAIVVIR